MVVALVYMVVLWLNNFPPRSGASDIYSPHQIICRMKLDKQKHCKLEFGAYAQVHEESVPTNTMCDHMDRCICLGPVGNDKGTIKFLKLHMGEVVRHRGPFTASRIFHGTSNY